MQSVTLVWATPDANQMLVDMARVSAPENQGKPGRQLIASLIRRGEWSPLEMAGMCVEVWTTRDIARQMLRHSSLRPQEFSQRYANISKLGHGPVLRVARMQHPTDRQASLPCQDEALVAWWRDEQQAVWDRAIAAYNAAIDRGVARECARVVLPEGNTPTRLYFSGWFRHWFHYAQLRMGHGTQDEHVQIAQAVWDILREVVPDVVATAEQAS